MARHDENTTAFEFGSGHPVTARPARQGIPGWLVFLLIVLLVVGGGGAYLYYFDRDLGQKLLNKTPLDLPVKVTTAYKWKDAEGNWQITDQPPAGNIPYETLKVRSDTNVLPAFQPESKKRN